MAEQGNDLDSSSHDTFDLSRIFELINEVDDDDDEDASYAKGLQLQEAVVASMMINKPLASSSLVVVEEPSESAELGESLQMFCEICAETKPDDRIFKVQNCHHFYCNDCIAKHIEVKLHNNTHTIVCPTVNCEEFIEFESCDSILPKTVLEKWDQLLCESSIQASQKYYCPFKDCSAMLLKDSDEIIREAECPSCFRLFCAQCSVPWHTIGCEEFQRLDVNEGAYEDLMLKKLVKDRSWNRCPCCKYYVEKTEGCGHMTCRCGFQFCYSCGATWTNNHGGCQPRQV
ncbi:OLC1v1014482C1 [Oldenlandia corymbosa var. corymbosa]|uniref:RBR-type E3 ubiquitin transferase n=1 Tax=Oldenlandia corymbosa var. corymbosa TaxID=529605 RepID=A0AAV1E147_OLDCO|nr:OLC1v1014482C1 [Oldenlandia corymbosa var. corymbosa]